MLRKLLAALAVGATLAGCGGENKSEIAIATIGPMTGKYASFGAQMKVNESSYAYWSRRICSQSRLG